MTSAMFGYARTLEQKLQDVKKLDTKSANEIISQYRDIIKEFPNTSTANESKYRIAVIYSSQLNDLDKAVAELKDITKKQGADQITASASLLLGEIYMRSSKIDDASVIFSNMINMYGKNALNFQNETDKAKYHLAEIEYYSGNLDSAKAHFELLTTNPKTDIANEALNKVIIIDQNKKFPDPLVIFAAAELKEMQGDNITAINKFYEASKLAGDAELAEQSLVRIADIYYNQLSYDSTRAVLSRLINDFPKTIFGDYALLRIGDTFALESNPTSALKYYNDLLVQYPRSIYLQDTRDKIRKLRANP
jgi:TolA-binding protein